MVGGARAGGEINASLDFPSAAKNISRERPSPLRNSSLCDPSPLTKSPVAFISRRTLPNDVAPKLPSSSANPRLFGRLSANC